jgi:hypothetical protein
MNGRDCDELMVYLRRGGDRRNAGHDWRSAATIVAGKSTSIDTGLP